MTRMSRRAPALAACAAAALAAVAVSAVPAQAAGTEYITNGTFTNNTDPWWGTDNLSLSVVSGRLCTQVPTGTTNVWDAIVGYNGIPLVKGDEYTVKFAASASVAATIKANVQLSEDPYTATMSRDTALTSTLKNFTYTFVSTLDAAEGQLSFHLGGATKAFRFCLDNVSVTSEPATVDPSGPERVRNGAFDEGMTSWYSYGTDSAEVTDGKLCAAVPAGLANVWDAGIGQNDIPLVEGATYTFSFEASASPSASVRATVQLGEEPYTAYLDQTVKLSKQATEHSFTFTAGASVEAAQVAFQVGGAAAEYTFCVDNVSLRGGDETAA